MTSTQLFHSVHYADAVAAGAFLTALGLTEVLVVADEQDPAVVHHAQYRWRDGGGVMLGTHRADNPHALTPGGAGCYLVVASDEEVDETYRRALAAGGSSVEAPTDMPYGGRGATVTDPEGNHWSFGSYAGE